jgi:hypothetical protein
LESPGRRREAQSGDLPSAGLNNRFGRVDERAIVEMMNRCVGSQRSRVYSD